MGQAETPLVFTIPSAGLVADHDPVAVTTALDGEPKGSMGLYSPVAGQASCARRCWIREQWLRTRCRVRATQRPGGSSSPPLSGVEVVLEAVSGEGRTSVLMWGVLTHHNFSSLSCLACVYLEFSFCANGLENISVSPCPSSPSFLPGSKSIKTYIISYIILSVLSSSNRSSYIITRNSCFTLF